MLSSSPFWPHQCSRGISEDDLASVSPSILWEHSIVFACMCLGMGIPFTSKARYLYTCSDCSGVLVICMFTEPAFKGPSICLLISRRLDDTSESYVEVYLEVLGAESVLVGLRPANTCSDSIDGILL